VKIVIIGQGYVGLSLAINAARVNKVIGFDLDSEKIQSLKAGISYIEGVGSDEIRSSLDSGNYLPTGNPGDLSEADIYVIAVPTPLNQFREPDLAFLESASQVVASSISKDCLVINESTSFPGTLRDLIKPAIESEIQGRFKVKYASSPERVDPGNSHWTHSNTARLVSGIDAEATELAREFYGTFCENLHAVSSPEVAELAKLFENTFRQVNIALVNEFAKISNGLSISVSEVLEAANTKPFGFMKFTPGLGVGGHCIPVDPSYLSYISRKSGIDTEFIDLANKVNLEMPGYVSSRIKSLLSGTLVGKKILIVGVAYKSDVADTRESPSVVLLKILQNSGADVYWHDDVVGEWSGSLSTPLVGDFDAVIVAILHSSVDVNAILNISPLVFDCTGKIESTVVHRL